VNGYAEIPTRRALDGTIDKLALVDAMATDTAHDREFAEFVLGKVSQCGSAADAQAACWAEYVERLPYRREQAEVLRDPRLVVGSGGRPAAGGDCDDMVVALLAGLRSLAIPCQPEIVASEDGWGFHIRGLVGLPPLNPKVWMVVDPVWRSEAEWAMADRDARDNALARRSPWFVPKQPVMSGTLSTPSSSWMTLALLGVGAWFALRLWPK
jgi:hypothetical protein